MSETAEQVSIMLVDDHAIVREGLRAMLESESTFKVIGEANHGEQAVQMATELQPRIILMDISMPVMDGLEATKLIKRQLPQCTVIILTMHHTESHVVQAIQAGASGYLLKDSPRREVLEMIRAASSGEVLISSALLRGAMNYAMKPATIEDSLEMDPLTPREREALALIADGKTNKEIAQSLEVSPETIKKLVQNVIGKLRASDRTHAAVRALRAGII